ncbi:MAG TPA: hypothetical protein VK474_11150 [Chthoniobacterales bacterium]|nr:hypothetical protein [Chthoniobacterales bacterium]
MVSSPFDSYIVIAPIAASFAGFGSLASGLGRGPGGDDARVDATRLSLMLFASLTATLLGLLPMTLAGILLDEVLAVRISALVALIAIPAYAVVGLRRAAKLRQTSGFSKAGVLSNVACATLAFAAFFLCLVGFPTGRLPAAYLVGLMGVLGSSAIMFLLVIMSMLRRHDR